jgi:hypothetical protein
MSATATLMPFSASFLQMASPSPCPPPVTIAAFPLRDFPSINYLTPPILKELKLDVCDSIPRIVVECHEIFSDWAKCDEYDQLLTIENTENMK